MISSKLKNTGFTMVELLVASTIGAFVILVSVGALKAISDSNAIVNINTNTASEARFAAGMIARDLLNLYRDRNAENFRLVGAVEETNQESVSFLTFYVINRVNARVDKSEGDVYEVEYFLVKNQEKSTLFRRLWPYPDKEIESGGVLTAIAENINVFEVRYFDGEEWSNEWPEQIQSLPQLVEVTIVAMPSNKREPVIETFVANFARLPQQTADYGEQGETERGSQQSETETGGQNQGANENANTNRGSETR